MLGLLDLAGPFAIVLTGELALCETVVADLI